MQFLSSAAISIYACGLRQRAFCINMEKCFHGRINASDAI
jgi:hypothetical protein